MAANTMLNFAESVPYHFVSPSTMALQSAPPFGYHLPVYYPDVSFVLPTPWINHPAFPQYVHVKQDCMPPNVYDENSFPCLWDQCVQVFSTRTGLATHCASHLEEHLKDACSNRQRKTVCCLWRACNEQIAFDNFRQLAKHLAEDSHIGQMPFLPKIVGVTVNSTEKRHRSAKQFRCSFPSCGKVFNDSSNCKKHQKTHDVNRERFYCPEQGCNKSYSTRTDLKIHIKVHKGEFTHKCTHPSCTKAFVRLSELYAHERTHDNMLPHACLDCGRRFREKIRLKKHQHSHGHTRSYPTNETVPDVTTL